MAHGVYQLKVPVPIPLVFVSAYLIEGPDGWTLLDTGFDYPDGRAAWEAGAERLGLDLRTDVDRILVSHFHPDHLGAARWLQGLSGAPVYMLGEEIEHSRLVWEGDGSVAPFAENLIRNGMPRDLAEEAASAMRSDLRLPDKILPLRADEQISLGESSARIIHAPGHADYQYMLHDESRGIFFAADHVLLRITPNIGLWPESQPHPLARYLKSLAGMRGMDVNLVLPGHGPIFHDLEGRIEELLHHHEERLEVMHGEIEGRPKDGFRSLRRRVPRDPDALRAVLRAGRDPGAPGSPRAPGPGAKGGGRPRLLSGRVTARADQGGLRVPLLASGLRSWLYARGRRASA